MNAPQLDSITINPKVAATASVIWMHGLGADGYDFADIVSNLNLPEHLGVRFVFPHAPIRPVTRANGYPMRAWFDLDLDLSAPPDEIGIKNSQVLINELIAQEIADGISCRKIVLAGFSQGGAMAMHCGLRYLAPVAGILSLSGFLVLADKLNLEKNISNQNTSILMIHGTQDPVIPIAQAKKDFEYLTCLGFNATLQTYSMEHTVCPEEVRLIAKWLEEVLDN